VASAEQRRARVAVFGYFFVLGAATATWAARLPAIKSALHLTDGRLGLALFAVPAGSVLTLALSGRIVDRFGDVRVVRVAGLLVCAAMIPIGVAPKTRDLAALIAALACFGAVAGLLDVAMNACGARLEVGYGRPILSSLHAGYSIAGLAGAGAGGISAWLGIGPLPTFAVVAAALAALCLVAGPRVVIPAAEPAAEHPEDPPHRSARQISVVIWILGLLALCGQLGEGSAGDWSAVYLHANLGTPAGVAAVALAAFSVTMAAGRIAGDRLAARFGSVRLVRASGLVAGIGLAAGLLIGTPPAAIAGFALLGAGLAGIFPQIVSSAARLDPGRAGRNIGRIAAVAYTGLLGGPVMIGAIASGVGLRDALLLPAALSLLVALLAGVMRPGPLRSRGDPVPLPVTGRGQRTLARLPVPRRRHRDQHPVQDRDHLGADDLRAAGLPGARASRSARRALSLAGSPDRAARSGVRPARRAAAPPFHQDAHPA
jgi:MFS family permease